MNTTASVLQLAQNIAAAWDWTAEFNSPDENRLDIHLPSMEQVVNVAAGMVVKRLGYLAAINGLSNGSDGETAELLYHFCREAAVITLRAQTPRPLKQVPSLASIIPNAKYLERHLRRVCLAETETPCRYYFPIDELHIALDVENETIINFDLDVDALPIVDELLNWQQALAILTKIYPASPQAHRLAYCLGLEQLAACPAPPRAQALRLVLAELERIAGHIQMLGEIERAAQFAPFAVTQRGGAAPFMGWINPLGGVRAILPGGVAFDLSERQSDELKALLSALDVRLRFDLDLVAGDSAYQVALQGKNTRSQRQTDLMGVTGPLARAAGVPRDIRLDAPYAGYQDYAVNIVMESAGDLYAGVMVLLAELSESIHLIRQVLYNLPEGSLSADIPQTIPSGEMISRVEAPEGELFYFLKSDGSAMPQHIAVCTPTACNLNSALKFSVHTPLADLPLVLAGCVPVTVLQNISLHIQGLSPNNEVCRWEQLLAFRAPDVV